MQDSRLNKNILYYYLDEFSKLCKLITAGKLMRPRLIVIKSPARLLYILPGFIFTEINIFKTDQ